MITGLLMLLLYIIVIGAILWVATIVIDRVPMDPTFKQVAKVIVLVIGLIVLIMLLIQFIGGASFPALG